MFNLFIQYAYLQNFPPNELNPNECTASIYLLFILTV